MDFKKLAEKRIESNPFAKLTGCVVTDISLGKAIVEHQVVKDSMNPSGSVHGGLMFTMADIAAGSAASSYGEVCTTVNSTFDYLRPALNSEKIIATAEEIKHGKRFMVFRVEVTDQDGLLLSCGTFVFTSLGKKIEL